MNDRRIKYPFQSNAIVRAAFYAIQSSEHTHDYDGFEKEDGTARKQRRIETGRFGQEWVKAWCDLNGILVETDKTAAEIADIFDLKIAGYSFDIKTSRADSKLSRLCQVNSALKKKDIDYYCFLRTDENFTHVEPLGIIKKKTYFEIATLIPYISCFPCTSIRNMYKDGSYIVNDLARLQPFEATFFELDNSASRNGKGKYSKKV